MALPFKTGEGFFKTWCQFGDTKIAVGSALPAMVLDARAELGTPLAVTFKPDGSQQALVKVSSEDGGWITTAQTAGTNTAPLAPDDIVLWQPLTEFSHGLTDDPRSRWIGLIVAKIEPTWHPEGWRILERY